MAPSFKFRVYSISALAVLMVGALPIANAAGQERPHSIAQSSSPSNSTSELKTRLTETQKARIETIRSQTSSQIVAILTPQQKAILQKAALSNQAPKSVAAALKLSQEQKQKIEVIKERSRKQIQAILTPEQRKVLNNISKP